MPERSNNRFALAAAHRRDAMHASAASLAEAHRAGYESGFRSGFRSGFIEAAEMAYDAGRSDGEDAGYELGRDDAEDPRGFDAGYMAALADSSTIIERLKERITELESTHGR